MRSVSLVPFECGNEAVNRSGMADTAPPFEGSRRRAAVSLPLIALAIGLALVAYLVPDARPPALGALALAALVGLIQRGARASRQRNAVKTDASSPLWPNASVKSVVDAMREPAFVLDRNLALRFSNAVGIQTFGNMALGDPIAMRFRAPELIAAMAESIESGEAQMTEYAERAPSERAWAVDILPMPMPGEARPVFFLALFRDRTQMRRLERIRTDFVANASHELRTPLASLSGFIETLKGPARDDPKARAQFLDIMQDQARRMSRLIDDLLSLSRIEMRRRLEANELTDLVSVMRVVAQQAAPTAAEKNLALELTGLEEGEALVNGDHDELVQVFGNLAENALKYGDAGGRIQIGLTRTDETVEAFVRDFGQGIPPEHVPRLTERFYRVEDGSGRVRGTGLGLSIVRNVLIRHNTRLSISSIPGQGSTFSVRFRLRVPGAFEKSQYKS